MFVELRSLPVTSFRALGLCAASAAIALGGCSASITRFDNPSFAIGEGASTAAPSRPASLPEAPSRPIVSQPASYQPAPARGGPVEVAGLSSVDNRPMVPESAAPRAMPAARQPVAPIAAQPASLTAPSAQQPGKGQQVEVQQGDTLYGIARRHKVLISDLMAVNELRNPTIRPGQKLYLPTGGEGRATPKVRPERTASLAPATERTTALAAPVVAADESGATYTVKPGDSLYAIAARHKVKVLELQRANNIKEVSKVKPGTVLRIPTGAAVAKAAPAHSGGEMGHHEARIVRVAAPVAPGPALPAAASPAASGVKVLNGTETARAPANVVADAGPIVPPAVQSGKLRWPVKGRVLHGFGTRPDGSQNDGVDIAAPAGTDVLAAEDGVVAYAGSEVKTYGNLVLVRHDNGWVTAYAYNDKLLVQRGDRVTRGQPVAKVGKTGLADQPLLHFEVRVGSKPVDPSGYLEKL